MSIFQFDKYYETVTHGIYSRCSRVYAYGRRTVPAVSRHHYKDGNDTGGTRAGSQSNYDEPRGDFPPYRIQVRQ